MDTKSHALTHLARKLRRQMSQDIESALLALRIAELLEADPSEVAEQAAEIDDLQSTDLDALLKRIAPRLLADDGDKSIDYAASKQITNAVMVASRDVAAELREMKANNANAV